MRRHVLLVNAASGRRRHKRDLQRLRRVLGLEGLHPEVHVLKGQEWAGVDRYLRPEPEALLVAGGDGTVGSAARALAGTRVPLGVLPWGTRNHFAKDAGLPTRPRAAARAIARARTSRVDVAEVNGHVFVNNASIGIYPRIVLEREFQRAQLGRSLWLAYASAAASALRRDRRVRVRVKVPTGRLDTATPFVFVGNNPYHIQGVRLGRRRSLQRGLLGIYLTGPITRAGLLKLPFRAVAGRLRAGRDYQAFEAPQARVDAERDELRAALDGEVRYLHPPLHFRSRPRSLRLLGPRRRTR